MDGELLQRAVRCYVAANLTGDACRCMEDLGDYAGAGRLHETAGRASAAAAAFVRSGAWRDAARCHLKAGRPVDAGECLLRAGDCVQAAWVFAEHARRFDRARAELARAAREGEESRADRDLVEARCEVASGAEVSAARRLRAFMAALSTLGAAAGVRLLPWALAVSGAMRRPDLTAELFASAYSAGIPRAAELWEDWARREYGDVTGVPDSDRDSK